MFGVKNYPDWKNGLKHALPFSAFFGCAMTLVGAWQTFSQGTGTSDETFWVLLMREAAPWLKVFPFIFSGLFLLTAFRPRFTKMEDNKSVENTAP